MKKLCSILLATLLLLTCIPIGTLEASATTTDYTYTINRYFQVTITGYTGYGGAITIPSTIDGYPVTTIGDNAFYGCDTLTSITIPDSVTTIDAYAFASESHIIISISVAEGNKYYSSVDGVLFNKDKTVLICYPEGKTGAYTIPDSVTTIGVSAFSYCDGLTEVTLPNSIATIERSAFYLCTGLTKVNVPDSVTTIGDNAFYGCVALTSITLPNSVTTIGVSAFLGCDALTSITLPNSVTTIGRYTFYSSGLHSITIPDSVTTIDYNAFSYCTLTSITISNSVTSISNSAFFRCFSLSNVYYVGTEAEFNANMTVGSSNDGLSNATWHYVDDPISDAVSHSVMDTDNGSGLAFRFELTANGVAMKNGTTADLTNATINYLGTDHKLIGMGAVITNDANIGNSNLSREQSNGQTVIDIPIVYLQEATDTSCAFATRLINIPDNQLERVIYARPYYIVEVDGEEIVVYGDVDAASCAEYM